MENPLFFDNFQPNNMGDGAHFAEKYADAFVGDHDSEHYKHYGFGGGAAELGFNQDFYGEMPNYLNFESLEECDYDELSPTAERSKAKVDDDALMQIFENNGIYYESREEVQRVLSKIRENYAWEPGFTLQLGSKGRKAMLQLLRKAYRSSKKNKRIFQNKKPPSTISNLPFFKISMLWELAHELGVLDQAILIHEIFGNDRRKLIATNHRAAKLEVEEADVEGGPPSPLSGSPLSPLRAHPERSFSPGSPSFPVSELAAPSPLLLPHTASLGVGLGMDEVERSPNRARLLTEDDFMCPINDGYVVPIREFGSHMKPFLPASPPFAQIHLDGQTSPLRDTSISAILKY